MDTTLFAGTSTGDVFVSRDYGERWTAANTGLTSKYIRFLMPTSTNIYVGTLGGGVWRRSITEVNTGVIMQLKPGVFNV